MKTNLVGALQRVSPAAALPALLRELSIDSRLVFDGLSFGPEDFVADARVPFDQGLIVLDRASRLARMPELGLLVGIRNDHRCLGLVGDLIAAAPTLGQALADYVRVQGGMSQAACVYLIPMGDCIALGFGVYDRFAPGIDQVYFLAMGTAVNMVRSLSGNAVAPVEVHFSCRAPSDPDAFAEHLKAEVRFNQSQTCVLLARRALSTPNPFADATRKKQIAALVATKLGMDRLSVSERLRHRLRPALSLGETTLSAIARRLHISERSLNRRLAEEGTTFQQERDAVRFVMASELLALTDLRIGDISVALSYANHSAFVRSYRRWSGKSPSQWRSENAASRHTWRPSASSETDGSFEGAFGISLRPRG